MRARVVAAALGAAALLVGPSAVAQADVVPGAAIAVTGDEKGDVVVDVSEEDGTWSGSLEVTNASDAVVELAVAVKSGLDEDCAPPEVSPDQVGANRVQSVTVEVSCEVPDGGAVVVLTLGPDDNRTVDVTLEPATSEAPDWTWLLVVLVAAALAAAAPVVPVYRRALRRTVQEARGPTGVGPGGRGARASPSSAVRGPRCPAPHGLVVVGELGEQLHRRPRAADGAGGVVRHPDLAAGHRPEGRRRPAARDGRRRRVARGHRPLALKLVGPTSPRRSEASSSAPVTLTGTFLQVRGAW